ncbi:MAG TPA: translation initiation factor IF-3, partial [Rhizomicrobium sp.]|nr:translation initiation factor IF-3 [Rhizomicrobium sp.]
MGKEQERVIVVRRFQPTEKSPAKDGPRINDEITARTVFLIGDDGHKYGELGLDEALALGEEKGFDVVEVSPDNKPPVCKLMDYGKYKYEQQKKAAEARKKQKVIEIKEIKMRPTIDDHDYDVKMRAMKR